MICSSPHVWKRCESTWTSWALRPINRAHCHQGAWVVSDHRAPGFGRSGQIPPRCEIFCDAASGMPKQPEMHGVAQGPLRAWNVLAGSSNAPGQSCRILSFTRCSKFPVSLLHGGIPGRARARATHHTADAGQTCQNWPANRWLSVESPRTCTSDTGGTAGVTACMRQCGFEALGVDHVLNRGRMKGPAVLT